MNECRICGESDGLGAGVKLTEKGANGVNNASKLKQSELVVLPGDFVHVACRKKFINVLKYPGQ